MKIIDLDRAKELANEGETLRKQLLHHKDHRGPAFVSLHVTPADFFSLQEESKLVIKDSEAVEKILAIAQAGIKRRIEAIEKQLADMGIELDRPTEPNSDSYSFSASTYQTHQQSVS